MGLMAHSESHATKSGGTALAFQGQSLTRNWLSVATPVFAAIFKISAIPRRALIGLLSNISAMGECQLVCPWPAMMSTFVSSKKPARLRIGWRRRR